MRRREFIVLLASGAAAAAQQSDGLRKLGVLMPLAETDQPASGRALRYGATVPETRATV
jgi:hypothetical protein